MPTGRAAALILLGSLSGDFVAGQASQQPPTVRSAPAEVVLVDVVVVDKEGRPVTDLQRDEFLLRDAGRTQTITHFERLELQEVRASSTPRPPVSTNTGPETARATTTLAILFDEQHLSPPNLPDARKAVLSLLDRGLGVGDELLLAGTGHADYWKAGRPSDVELLRAMVAKLGAMHVRTADEEIVSEAEAMQIIVQDNQRTLDLVSMRLYDDAQKSYSSGTMERIRGGASTLHSTSVASVYEYQARSLASRVWLEASRRATATLASIEALSRALAPRRGRKSVVLVTEGFVLDGQSPAWQQTLAVAQRANVVVYAIDARGLRDSAAGTAETGRISTGNDRVESAVAGREAAEGSDALVAETGGFTRRYTNDLGAALGRIATENRNYYLLGFAPGAPPDGVYHPLSVEVRRPGLTVRARKGYYALAQAEAARPASDQIPLRLAVFVLEPRGDAVHVQVVGEIDPGAIHFENHDGRFSAAIDWSTDVVTAGAKAAEPPRRLQLNLTPEALTGARVGWVPVGAEFDLPPGLHVARLFVRDGAGDRVGKVEHVFEVPSPRSPYVSAVLSDLARTEEGSAPAPVARRTFGAGAHLLYLFEVRGEFRRGAPRQLLAGHELCTAEGAVLAHAEDSPLTPAAGGSLARLLRISLEKTPPGRYEIRLHVQDDNGGSRLEWVEPFEVVAQPASP